MYMHTYTYANMFIYIQQIIKYFNLISNYMKKKFN